MTDPVLTEKQIQRQVMDFLALRGWLVLRLAEGPFGVKGISDLLVIKNGHLIFVELKSARGRQSLDQRLFQRAVQDHGGMYKLVRSLDDIMDWA